MRQNSWTFILDVIKTDYYDFLLEKYFFKLRNLKQFSGHFYRKCYERLYFIKLLFFNPYMIRNFSSFATSEQFLFKPQKYVPSTSVYKCSSIAAFQVF